MSIEEFTHSLAEYINADTPADHAQAIRDFAAACRRYDEDPCEQQRIRGIADLIKAEDANYAQAVAALDRSDHDAALPLLREAAKEGIGEAAWLLAGLLEQKGDPAGAITWYQRAADDGDSRASDKLTDMHSQSATADNAIEALPGPDYLAGTESGHMKHIDRPASSTERALTLDKEPKGNHRGGGRPGPRRLLIPAAILTEAGMAYVAMEAPIGSQPLAIGLAVLAALIGAAATCILANRRFSRFPVLATRRIPKGRMTLAAIAAAAAVAMVATAVLITRPAGGALLSHTQPAASSSSPASPVSASSSASPVSAQPSPQFANADAVVNQFYEDITDHNYSAAWALGGDNIAKGVSYATWAAGYADTTASIALGTMSDFGSGQVQAQLSTTQPDGTVKTYEGTYTVENGVIVAAEIVQTS